MFSRGGSLLEQKINPEGVTLSMVRETLVSLVDY